jgi:death on curing protein
VPPIWLTEPQLIRINQRLVEKTGEPHGLRDAGLLAAAMASPMRHWENAEIGDLAGALLLGIGRVQPFESGNRRTALIAAIIFLAFNGHAFAAPDGDDLGTFVERAITGAISEAVFLQAMRDATVTIEEWGEFLNSGPEQP